MRRTAFPVSEIIAADWRGAERSLKRNPHLGRLLPSRRPCARATGTIFRNPGLARSLRAIAQHGRDAFYRGPLAEAIVRYSHGRRRALRSGRFRRAHQQFCRSGLDQLPRLRRLGASAQRPGDRRAPDAQPARAVRPEKHGPAIGRGSSSDDRGQEAGLRRSGQVLRRPRFRPAADRGA